MLEAIIGLGWVLLMGGCLIAAAVLWPEKRTYEKDE